MPRRLYNYHGYNHEEDFTWSPNYAPDEKRLKNKKDLLLIGVELEMDEGGESGEEANIITEAIGFPNDESYNLVASCDGSLTDGIEIISQPSTLKYHQTVYDWAHGMATASSRGYVSHDGGRCGLHFHVGRRYFEDAMDNPEETIMTILINNLDWIKRFSRRENWTYCNMPCREHEDDTEEINGFEFHNENEPELRARLRSLCRDASNHYSGMNYSNNPTIEFRFCRGTLKYETFMASMELVSMICYAAKKFRIEQAAALRFSWFRQYAKTVGYKEFLDYTWNY